MGKKKKNLLHLGVDLEPRFVSTFRRYCRTNNFKQLALIKNLANWWLNQDVVVQEHIYNGRLEEVAKYFRSATKSDAIVDEIAIVDASTSHKRKRKEPNPVKSA